MAMTEQERDWLQRAIDFAKNGTVTFTVRHGRIVKVEISSNKFVEGPVDRPAHEGVDSAR